MSQNTLKVGDTVWIFDADHRVYAKATAGNLWSSGGPIFREHFIPRTITAETSRSWILNDAHKVDKKTLTTAKDFRGYRKQIVTSQAQIDDACYVHDEVQRITRAVQTCRDADTLRAIDALLKKLTADDD